MPGPSGEACSNCYWWDLDRKNKQLEKKDGKKKYYWYADCCYGDPGSKAEIANMREDLFCSEHMNREYGIEEFRRAREAEEEVENEGETEEEEEAEENLSEAAINLLESIVELLNNRSEEHTSELQSHSDHVCRLLLEKKKNNKKKKKNKEI